MKLKSIRAQQGLMWLRAGLAMFGRQPLGFAALLALFGIVVVVLLQIPLLGSLAALMLMPWLNLAFLLGTREALAGKAPHPGLLIAPMRDALQRKRLLQVGAAYAAGTVLVVLLAHVLDGGAFTAAATALANDEATPEAVMADGQLAGSVLIRLALLSALSLVFWHVPGLVCWGGLPLGKAMFASVLACWEARGALVLFGLGWGLMILLGVSIIQVLFASLDLLAVLPQAVVPLAMLATTAFYASLYFGFVDSFDFGESAPPADEATPPNLA